VILIMVIRAAILGLAAALLWVLGHPVADIPLGVLALAAFLFVKPYRACRWCRPGGLIGGSALARLAGHKPKRRRPGSCWRCKRTRLTRRLGAYHVHKVRQSLAQAWEEREFWR